MIKFNSPYEPIRLKPKKTDKRTISGDYLDYNQYGQVEIKHGQDIDLMEISQAAKEGTELSEQIAMMIKNNTLQEAELKESMCADVSEMPKSITEAMQNYAAAKKRAEASESELVKKELGFTGKELASMTDEQINSVLNTYIEKRAKESEKNEQQ